MQEFHVRGRTVRVTGSAAGMGASVLQMSFDGRFVPFNYLVRFVTKTKINHSRTKLVWINVGSIGENDDREFIVNQSLNKSVKATGIAIVPHLPMSPVGVEEPAESVL